MKRIVLLFMLLFPAIAPAQNGSNPFELVHRLPKTSLAGLTVNSVKNPFDMAPHKPPRVSAAAIKVSAAPFKPFSFFPQGNTLSDTALFWVLIGAFGFLAFSVATNRGAVEKAWRGFLNDNALNVAQREASGFTGITPYYLLYTSFLINAAIFIFLIARFLSKEKFANFSFLFFCLGLAAIFFLSKHLVLNLMGNIYGLGAEVRRYNFLIIVFNCVLGLFLVPFNLFIAFSKMQVYEGFLVFWTLGLISIFFLYRAVRALNIGSKFLAGDIFHFLLYLCAVELAPLLLVVKLLTLQ